MEKNMGNPCPEVESEARFFKTRNHMILDSIKNQSLKDCAFGCILGAFVGDSCGSHLEFI